MTWCNLPYEIQNSWPLSIMNCSFLTTLVLIWGKQTGSLFHTRWNILMMSLLLFSVQYLPEQLKKKNNVWMFITYKAMRNAEGLPLPTYAADVMIISARHLKKMLFSSFWIVVMIRRDQILSPLCSYPRIICVVNVCLTCNLGRIWKLNLITFGRNLKANNVLQGIATYLLNTVPIGQVWVVYWVEELTSASIQPRSSRDQMPARRIPYAGRSR